MTAVGNRTKPNLMQHAENPNRFSFWWTKCVGGDGERGGIAIEVRVASVHSRNSVHTREREYWPQHMPCNGNKPAQNVITILVGDFVSGG